MDGDSHTPRPCSRCGGERDRPSQRLCRRCKTHYDRGWRAKVRAKAKRALELLQASSFGKDVSRETQELLEKHAREKS